MKPAVSQICTLPTPLERDVADYASAACRTIELWLGKVETYLEQHAPGELRALFEAAGVETPVASYQGGLLDTEGAARAEHWRHFRQRLNWCRELGIETLVVAADVTAPVDERLIQRVEQSLDQAATEAAAQGVRLALEFQARASLINNLETASALVEEVASEHLGICLDAFHFAVGPSKLADLGYLTRERLFHVQLCDVAGQLRELAGDADRVLPGDGDFPLEAIVAHLRAIGYSGCVSVELMNPQIWPIAAQQVAELSITALRKVLGLATMV